MIIVCGLICELFGGILLASEMIGLVDKIRKCNLGQQIKIKVKEKELVKIQSKYEKFLLMGVISIFVYMFVKINNSRLQSLKIMLSYYRHFFSLRLSNIIILITRKVLHFSERVSAKLGTEKVLGFIGVIFLCIGFVIELCSYMNLIC